MDKAFPCGAGDSGLIPNLAKSMTVKLVFTAFLLDAQAAIKENCVEKAGKFTRCAIAKGT